MAYKSKFKGKEIDDKLDLVQELSEDISDIKEDIKNTIQEETDPVFSNSPAASITEKKKAEWDNKVDKVSGKQLSTEDFTTILKTKLEGLSNYDDTELSKALSTLRGDFNKLVSGDTTTAIKTFNEIIAFLDGIQDSQDLSSIIASIEQQITAKQDRITDLDAIRRGAEKGATAVQPASLADYISKDDVDAELSGTSTNPIQNQAVEGALSELANAIGIFLAEKQPVIPDLEAIRAGATKGATALQSSDVDSEVSETSTNPVQNRAVAGAFNEIVGLLESTLSIIGGRFDSKQDTLVSGENIKTVNGESILGEGNITIEGGGGGGGIAVETDPIFSTSPAADITEEKMAEWDNKYAKPSGGIPTTDLASDVQSALAAAEAYKGTVIGVKANNATKMPTDGIIDLGTLGTYSKPSTGIPKSDLSSDVHTSLEKADTALQAGDLKDEVYIADFTIESLRDGIYNGTNVDCNVQGLVDAMNANKVILVREGEDSSYKGVYVLNGYAEDLLYFSIVDTSGNILWCNGADYGSWQSIDAQSLHERSWDDKQDTLVSGENIKTINGESIVGSGNITIGGSGSAQLPLNNVVLILNGSTLAIPSGKVTDLTLQQTGGGTFALSADKKVGEDNVWVIRFAISSDNLGIYQVVADEGYSIKWANGVAPTFEKGKFYELSFRLISQTFLGVWASFE